MNQVGETTAGNKPPLPAKGSIQETVATLQVQLRHSDSATLAALRRADPAAPPMEFYRLSVRVLDDILPGDGRDRSKIETQWLLIMSSMARSFDLWSRVDLGQAMARAKVAEARVVKLLEARGNGLADILRTIVHQLVQKGQSFDPVDIAKLVLSEGSDTEKDIRRKIARNFYRHQNAETKL